MYIRVDILERLFVKIMEKTKDGMFRIDSDMMNLIGCSKENFFTLLELMQYKRKKFKDEKEEFFIYKPTFPKNEIKKNNKKISKDNPFDKLTELRFR